jgi:hypothetical protein
LVGSRYDSWYMGIAQRWLTFADEEAKGRSPLYDEIARGVAADQEILGFLGHVPEPRQQPNLLLASVRYLGGTGSSFPAFRAFVLDHQEEVLQQLLTRSTQTNEVGRCAVIMLALAQMPAGPLALLEVGASAGLCLLLDRYTYRFGQRAVGDPHGPLQLACDVEGPAPLPERLPDVVWREGIDLNPLDVADDDDMRWLESCVWPDQLHRIARLRAAVSIAREDPPSVIRGDLLELTAQVASQAPSDANLVIFHSAVLAYLTPDDRRRFAETVAATRAVWLSNEGIGVVDMDEAWPQRQTGGLTFVLAQAGRPLALADSHGARVRWL